MPKHGDQVGSLPPEIWGMIMDNFVGFDHMVKENCEPLLALALVSHTMGAIATSRLYSRVDWHACSTLHDHREIVAFVKWIDVSLWTSTKPHEQGLTQEQRDESRPALSALVDLLPDLTSMHTLTIRISDGDDAWWSLIPPFTSPGPTGSLPVGLENLTHLHVDSSADDLGVKLSLRLMLLPKLRSLELMSMTSPSAGEWTVTDEESLARLYGTSTVETLALIECYDAKFTHLMHFVKLPKTLKSIDFCVRQDASLPTLKTELLRHRDTLRKLALFNLACNTLDVGLLGDLRAFRDLRRFEGELEMITPATKSSSMALLLPPLIECLQLVLCWEDDGAMDKEACLWQLREVVSKCPTLANLFVIGSSEMDDVIRRIEDECDKHEVELRVDSWA